MFLCLSSHFQKYFLPHLNGALLDISGLAEAVNSGLIVDSDEGTSGVDIVVGAGHIIALPGFQKRRYTYYSAIVELLGAASFMPFKYLLSWWLI